MKRLIIFAAVIALVAVAVFGGQALAAKPSGSLVAIETEEFAIEVAENYEVVSVSYPQVRHISLTVCARGVASPDMVEIWHVMPDGHWNDIATFDTSMDETYEFDSDNFAIDIIDVGGSTIQVSYYVTTTYER